MGVEPDELLARYQEAALNPIPWRETASAPAQEIVHREIDIARLLPLPIHNEHDSGPYLTAGLMITRNPRTGKQNVSIHRCQVSGPNRLGVLLLPRHAHMFFEMAERAGEPLHAAIAVGIDPLTLLASQAIVPIDVDELEIAGALQRRQLPVVKCLTSDLLVPAEAEIVIEGRLLPGVREPEGPFGEFPQYYGERAERHVMEIDVVTRRKDAILHTVVGGGLEHLLLGATRARQPCWSTCSEAFPTCATCTSRAAVRAAITSTFKSKSARRARRRTSCSAPLPATMTSSMRWWSTRTSTTTRPRSNGRWPRVFRPIATW
jgi:2,5-furandicarboxylate decarboxylase 1